MSNTTDNTDYLMQSELVRRITPLPNAPPLPQPENPGRVVQVRICKDRVETIVEMVVFADPGSDACFEEIADNLKAGRFNVV